MTSHITTAMILLIYLLCPLQSIFVCTMEDQKKYTSFLISIKNLQHKIRRSAYLPFIIVGIIVLILILWSVSAFTSKTSSKIVAGESSNKFKLEKPKAQQILNKTYEFPIRDAKGKEVSKIKYTLERAELRDEIIVKGQKASAVEGRTFLIINLKITNDFDKPIQINARDYIRLIINNSPEKLAADIHNDPVEVLAISTKLTRIGFPINDNDKNLTLQIGEVNSKKDTIKLALK